MLERLPYYGVFDYLVFRIDRGTVYLAGYSYQSRLKADAEIQLRRTTIEFGGRLFTASTPMTFCVGCEQEFFSEGHVKSNFLCNLGYGDRAALNPRLPRLSFTEACSLL